MALSCCSIGYLDPGNLGLILRTAEAAGCDGVVVSPGTVDPLNPKCVRASAGSVFRLPVAHAGLETAAAALTAGGGRLFATSPSGGVVYTEADLSGRVGLLLGQEGGGLARGFLDRFEGLRIPTGRVESLNVAMAAGVLLYEAYRQRTVGGWGAIPPAAFPDSESVLRLLLCPIVLLSER